MRTGIGVLGLTLFLAATLLARDKTDVMIMQNGDTMTCEVKGLASGVLYVSFDYIDGTASVDWSKVARLESSQLFVVRTQDGSVYTGKLGASTTGASRPVSIQVIEAENREIAIDRTQIIQMTATSEKLWQRFGGELSLGAIYSKGNQATQYSLSSETAYIRERWNAQAGLDSNLSVSSGSTASTRNEVRVSALHLLPWHNWFYSGLAGFLQSSEQKIALQNTFGGGIGRYLKKTNETSLTVLAGAAWINTTYEQSLVPVSKQNTAAALIRAEARFFRFSKTNLYMAASILPAVSDPGRVRFTANASYFIKIIGNLKWNFSFFGNWDNRPPRDFSGSDYGTSSGLSWTYGVK